MKTEKEVRQWVLDEMKKNPKMDKYTTEYKTSVEYKDGKEYITATAINPSPPPHKVLVFDHPIWDDLTREEQWLLLRSLIQCDMEDNTWVRSGLLYHMMRQEGIEPGCVF